MGFVKEFKEFALKGNLVDMAIGVVIGGAFGKVVTAFIDGMIMPLIGKMVGNVDFNNLYMSLSDTVDAALTTNSKLPLEEAKKLGPVIAYGSFITVALDFIIVALVLFMVIKMMNRMKKQQEAEAPAAPPAPSKEEVLLTEIRDALRK
jgi:large conductance mechanosensitive channel